MENTQDCSQAPIFPPQWLHASRFFKQRLRDGMNKLERQMQKRPPKSLQHKTAKGTELRGLDTLLPSLSTHLEASGCVYRLGVRGSRYVAAHVEVVSASRLVSVFFSCCTRFTFVSCQHPVNSLIPRAKIDTQKLIGQRCALYLVLLQKPSPFRLII